MEIRTESLADHGRVIAEIARELNVPLEHVERVFHRELSRLTARARIQQFVPTLAVCNTRRLLRGYQMRPGRE